MSGFLSHIAARGMGQARAVHSAARLPYASPPALVETPAETLAPPPSLQSPPLGRPPQGLTQEQLLARPDAASIGEASAAPAPPSTLLQRPLALAPAPKDVAARDNRKTREAPDDLDRPFRRPADALIGAVPDPIVPPAAHSAEAASAADDEASGPLRRIQPLLPAQQGLNGAALFRGASAAPGAAWRTPAEETTEVHVSIGRIEVTAVHEAAPAPKRAPARGQRALSLEEYLARRKAGRS